MLSDLHKDIRKWITIIEQDQQINNDARATIIKKLDEALKMKSMSKIIASVLLIPGFVRYEHHIEIQMDWKKWVERIKAAVSG